MKIKKSDVQMAIQSSDEGFVLQVLNSIESEHGKLSDDESSKIFNSVCKWLERSVGDFEFERTE